MLLKTKVVSILGEIAEILRRPDQIGTPRDDRPNGFFRSLLKCFSLGRCRASPAGARSAWPGQAPELIQITLDPVSDDLRLRRLPCGKALPSRRACVQKILLRAGWKAEPSSLLGGEGRLRRWPESQRLSANQGGRAAFSPRWVSNLGSSGGGPGPTRIILFLTLERSGGSLLALSQDSAGKRRQGKAKGTRQGGKAGEMGKRY